MNIKIFLLSLAISILAMQHPEDNPTRQSLRTQEVDGLVGRVHKVTSKITYYKDDGTLDEGNYSIAVDTYNITGGKLSSKGTDSDSKHFTKESGLQEPTEELYIYDNKGRLIAEILHLSGHASELYGALYDKEGRLAEERFLDPEMSPPLRKIYGYNKHGLRISATSLTIRDIDIPDNMFVSHEELIYNDAKQLAEIRKTNEDGSQFVKTYTYDKNGRLIETAVRRKDGQIERLEKYDFNASGDLISHVSCGKKGLLLSEKLTTYSSRGKKTEERAEYYTSSSFQEIIDTYDLHGNLLKSRVISPDGTFQEQVYEYVYDKIGNWIKEKASTCKSEAGGITCKPDALTNRTIEYFKD
jgi:YD repeat-containing protein